MLRESYGCSLDRLQSWMAESSRALLRRHSEPDVVCPYVPESNIVCFRVGAGDQLALRDRLLADGRLHIGSTMLAGERYLRLVVMAPDTDEATLAELLRELRADRSLSPGTRVTTASGCA